MSRPEKTRERWQELAQLASKELDPVLTQAPQGRSPTARRFSAGKMENETAP